MPCNTCFVLGAGFSAAAKLPVQSALLKNISGKNAEYIQKIFNCGKNDKILKNIALEDVFTFLDKIITRNENAAGFDIISAYKAKRDLIDYIIDELNDALKELNSQSKYESFFNSIVKRKLNGETNTIVTINWDTIPDFYINHAYKERGITKGGVDYGCYDWDYDGDDGDDGEGDYVPSVLRKAKGYSTVKVLKLHGSINWSYSKKNGALYVREQTGDCPKGLIIEPDRRDEYEHIFMTPTFIKDLSNLHTQSIWHNASFDLSEAQRVVFLGCSLPLADYEFRHLLLKTAVRNKKNKIRVLIYPKSSLEQKKEIKGRFETLFAGNDIKFEELDIAEFLERKDLIWGW